MVEQAEREPTMDEIVVALREARRGAGGAPPLTVVGGQNGIDRRPDMRPHRNDSDPGHSRNHPARDPIDTACLREQEIERLLAENARLNQRVMFLLNTIDDERAHHTAPTTTDDAIEAIRAATAREVRSALEAELRPLLLAVLRLLEKRASNPTAPPSGNTAVAATGTRPCPTPGIRQAKRNADHPAMPSERLLELIGKLDGQAADPVHQQAAPPTRTLSSRPGLRRKLASLFRSSPN